MKARSFILLFTALTSALLMLAACGGDDDGGSTGDASTGTPTAAPTNDGGGDGGSNDTGSASVDFSGEVEGSLELSGMSCDFFPNDSANNYRASISGNVGDQGFTIDVSGQLGEVLASVKLTRSGEAFSTWDNEGPTDDGGVGPASGSGIATFTEEGGELSFLLHAQEISPGAATADVNIDGSWTCPGAEYQAFGQ